MTIMRVLAAVALLAGVAQAEMLVVLNKAANTASLVDPASMAVVATVPTGAGPHEGIASADGKRVYVANYGGQQPGSSLSIIDLEKKTSREVSVAPLLRPHGLWEAEGKIWFTAEGSRVVARFDPATEKVDWVMGTGQNVTHMVVFAPQQKKVYTANILSDTVTAIKLDVPPAQQVKQIATGKQPEGMDLSADGKELWVGTRADGGIAIIDTANDSVKETLQVGKVPIRVKFTPDGKHVLVSDPQRLGPEPPQGELIVLDAATRKEVKRLKVGLVPIGIQIGGPKRAYVAVAGEDKVVEIDLEKLEVGRSVKTGAGPDGMAYAR